MKYQPHIDGLRAIAVISVILFHLDIHLFKGGFVGVDIFFVISGFLITKVIINEIETTGSFSFSNFYIRRSRRLFPALFVTLLITTIFTSIIFTSEYLKTYGSELVASVLSLSNFLFWSQSGYFDNISETKALLHTWSLSVEEQFYIFWPIVLFLTYKKLSPNVFSIFLILTFTFSLQANVYNLENEITWFKNQTSSTFFLMPFRIHEFFLGVFAVWIADRLHSNKVLHELLFWVGLLMIIYSVLNFDNTLAFPHYNALIPCIGTALIILARHSWSSSILLENKIAIWIGLISYSLYLTHWPLIVLYKFLNAQALTAKDQILLIALTFFLSYLLFHIIEKRFRKQRDNKTSDPSHRTFIKYTFVSMIMLSLIGSAIYSHNGLEKYKQELFSATQIKEGKSKRFSQINRGCKMRDLSSVKCHNQRPIQVLVFGNSHEPDGYNSFQYILKSNERVNLITFGSTNHCNIYISENREIKSEIERYECNTRANKFNETSFVESLDVLVYSANKPFADNKNADWEVLSYLKQKNPTLRIIVLGTYFNTKKDCSEIANKFNSSDACKSEDSIAYSGNLEYLKTKKQELKYNLKFVFFDKFKALCKDSKTNDFNSCETETKGVPMFYDIHHLSLEFAQYLGQRYSDLYKLELNSLGLITH